MKIYVDGSARPTNPGPGGLGIVVCDDNDEIITTIFHESKWTTNNQQELLAILLAATLYGDKGLDVTIFSDSAYAINTLSMWSYSWRQNDWLKSDGKIPENLEIIQYYHDLLDQGYRVNLQKVKGHSTCRGNQLADTIASGKEKAKVII